MDTALKILLIEDSPTWVKLVKHFFEEFTQTVEVISVSSWMQASRHINHVDFVIIDWLLEDGVAPENCNVLDILKKLNLPYVITTSNTKMVPESLRGDRLIAKENFQSEILKRLPFKLTTNSEDKQ